MANQLKVVAVNAIEQLLGQGWSQRRVARELGVDRETVARYARLARQSGSGIPDHDGNPAKAPSGSLGFEEVACDAEANPAGAPLGSETVRSASEGGGEAKPTGAPSGSMSAPEDSRGAREARASPISGAASQCTPFREKILAKLEQGLSAKRIHQDLVAEHGFAAQYHSVRRFVRRLGEATPLPFRRMECAPAEQAQIDFGTGAAVIAPDGKRRRSHVFRIVLSHSRKAYSEAVYRQTTEEFLRCIENAFWSFGGVPQTLVIDNLKAAVTEADWYDPELHPKIQSFGRYYGTTILPTKPRTPRHKGKIERGIGYVKGNGLKGRSFLSLEEENRHLREWEATVADTRIHGTTRRQVGKVFEEVERPALRPLPTERFPAFQEAPRQVHRDAHVEVGRTYYSVPPEYVGRQVWVRWDSHTVRVFNGQMTQIAVHARNEAGHFSTQPQHIVSEKISRVERGATWLLDQARQIGPQAGRWGEAMLEQRGIEGVRVLNGLLRLTHKHPTPSIEKACEIATTHGAYRLRVIRTLIGRETPPQEQFEFIDQHPIIRSLADYGQWVHTALQRDPHWESKLDEIGSWKEEKEKEQQHACTKRYKRP
jgi:transposase